VNYANKAADIPWRWHTFYWWGSDIDCDSSNHMLNRHIQEYK